MATAVKEKAGKVPVIAKAETAPVQHRRRRTKTLRGANEVDRVVLDALQRLRAEKGDIFKAGAAEVMEHFDPSLRVKPSRAGAYRAVKRMAGLLDDRKPLFTIAKEGERGRFTYNFTDTPAIAPARRSSKAAADGTVNGDLGSLIAEYTSINGDVDRLMAQLRVRIDAKKSEKKAIEAALSAA